MRVQMEQSTTNVILAVAALFVIGFWIAAALFIVVLGVMVWV